MPRARFHKLDPEKQAQILAAATDEFAEHGFERSSYNRIIEKAGVSKGAMYYYFEDKMDLYATVLIEVHSHAQEAWGEALADDRLSADFWGGVEAISHLQMKVAMENPQWMALGRTLVELDPALLHEGPLEEIHNMARGWIARLLEKGRELGEVRDDVPLELLVAAVYAMGEAFDRWFVAHWDEVMGTDEPLDSHVHMMVDMMRRVAAPPQRPKDES